MYGAVDPSIAGMVLDSPFSNLVDLMMELVDTYKYPLPKFTVSSLMISTSPLVSCYCGCVNDLVCPGSCGSYCMLLLYNVVSVIMAYT